MITSPKKTFFFRLMTLTVKNVAMAIMVIVQLILEIPQPFQLIEVSQVLILAIVAIVIQPR